MANNIDQYFRFFDYQNERVQLRTQNPAWHKEWVIDTGASANCTNIADGLYNIQKVPSRTIICANGGTTSTDILGDVDADGKGLLAKNVLYIPTIETNLLSVGCLARDDHILVFDKNGCEIYNEGDVTIEGIVKARGRLTEDGLYTLIASGNGGSYSRNLWHRRLCHTDITELILLKKYMTTGINMEENDERIECLVPFCSNYFERSVCPLYMAAFNSNTYPKATEPLELVYFYVASSTYNLSLNGNKYYIIFVDDYTRKTFVYFLKSELEVIPKFDKFKNYVEMFTGKKIKHLSTEFDTNCLHIYSCIENHIANSKINFICCRNENSITKWLNYIIPSKLLCLMTESNLPNEFWAEAISAVVNFLNVSTNTGLPFMTPHQAWTGRKPDLSAFRVFGCKAYLPCLKKYVLHLGFDFEKRGYRFMDTTHYGVYYRAKGIFYEDEKFFKNNK